MPSVSGASTPGVPAPPRLDDAFTCPAPNSRRLLATLAERLSTLRAQLQREPLEPRLIRAVQGCTHAASCLAHEASEPTVEIWLRALPLLLESGALSLGAHSPSSTELKPLLDLLQLHTRAVNMLCYVVGEACACPAELHRCVPADRLLPWLEAVATKLQCLAPLMARAGECRWGTVGMVGIRCCCS